MARDINRLLNKKGWTGEEVGKALVASAVHDIKHHAEPNYKPLFSQSDFDRMERSLQSGKDFREYGVYRAIYHNFIDCFNHGQFRFQQFSHGHYRYLAYLKDVLDAERAYERAEQMPYILTEEQYDRFKEQAEDCSKDVKMTFKEILADLLYTYISDPEVAPDAIKNAIEATKEEVVTDQRILDAYRVFHSLGYYQMPDGTRSDQVTIEEWQAIREAEYMRTHTLTVDGENATYEETMQHFNQERRLKGYELYFKGFEEIARLYKEQTGENVDQADEAKIMHGLELMLSITDDYTVTEHPVLMFIESYLNNGVNPSPTEWHWDQPENLTKYDALDLIDEYEQEDGSLDTKAFKADYPVLYKAIEAYIKDIVPQAKNLKVNQYNKPLVSAEELVKLHANGYKEFLDSQPDEDGIKLEVLKAIKGEEHTLENVMKAKRIVNNGIVIAKNPKRSKLDENGNYSDPANLLITFHLGDGIDSITQDENALMELEAFQENMIKPALSYVYAFNTLVKILSSVYELEEMSEVELETKLTESQIESFNNLIYFTYANVYGVQADEKERKRKLIKEVFKPIDYEKLKPTQEAIDVLTDELVSLGFTDKATDRLKSFDRLIDELAGRKHYA